MDSGILMIQDSILVCSPDPRIPHTAEERMARFEASTAEIQGTIGDLAAVLKRFMDQAEIRGQTYASTLIEANDPDDFGFGHRVGRHPTVLHQPDPRNAKWESRSGRTRYERG
jgi:hypothetical protein